MFPSVSWDEDFRKRSIGEMAVVAVWGRAELVISSRSLWTVRLSFPREAAGSVIIAVVPSV